MRGGRRDRARPRRAAVRARIPLCHVGHFPVGRPAGTIRASGMRKNGAGRCRRRRPARQCRVARQGRRRHRASRWGRGLMHQCSLCRGGTPSAIAVCGTRLTFCAACWRRLHGRRSSEWRRSLFGAPVPWRLGWRPHDDPPPVPPAAPAWLRVLRHSTAVPLALGACTTGAVALLHAGLDPYLAFFLTAAGCAAILGLSARLDGGGRRRTA